MSAYHVSEVRNSQPANLPCFVSMYSSKWTTNVFATIGLLTPDSPVDVGEIPIWLAALSQEAVWGEGRKGKPIRDHTGIKGIPSKWQRVVAGTKNALGWEPANGGLENEVGTKGQNVKW